MSLLDGAGDPSPAGLTATERCLDEEELIGAILLDPPLREEVKTRLVSQCFTDRCLGEAFGGCLRLDGLTTQSLAEHLMKHETLLPPRESGWISFLERLKDAAQGLSHAGVQSHVGAIRKRWIDRRRRDALIEAGTAGAQGENLATASARSIRVLTEIEEVAAAKPSISSGFVTADVLFGQDPLPRVPIIDGGVFDTGMYGIGYGPDGSGKSIGTAHMVVDVAAGVPYFGIPTCGPVPVAYLYTDDDRDEVRKRLNAIMLRDEVDSPEVARRIHILARPFPWGPSIDLVDTATIRGIIHYLKDNDVRLLAIDHIAACHRLPAFDYMPLIAAVDQIAQEADCGVYLLGHPSKAANRVGPDDHGSDDLYGDSRLRNFARLRVRFSRSDRDRLYRMKFEKVSRSCAPQDVWLAQEGSALGDPSFCRTEVVNKAKTARADRIARIPEILATSPGRGMEAADLAKAIGVGERALRNYDMPEGVVRDRGRYVLEGDPRTGESC